jgi:hypothetical protein
MRSLRFLVYRVVLVLVLIFGVRSNAAAWWEKGHRIATACAVEVMPEEVPAFFREQGKILQYLSGEADRWKQYGPMLRAAERPNHYVDLEMLNEDVSQLDHPLRRTGVDRHEKVVSNKGIHKRFEGPMVEQYVEVGDCRKFMRAPIVLEDVAEAVRKAMLISHSYVDEVYRQDDAGKFEMPDRASKELVRARLAFGAQFLSDLWYTAWVRSAEENEQ